MISFTKLRRDEGSAMVAVLMLTMVVAALAVGAIQVAEHSNDVTTVDRERFQTISSAEAGVNDALRRIEDGAGCDASATAYADLKDGDKLVGRYRTKIDPESGTTCGQTPRRVIESWGFAPTGGTRAMRHLEVSVELIPESGFPFSLFAEGGIGTIYNKNTGEINGDVYAEVLDQSKNNLSAKNVISPDTITTRNNASYSGTLWAGGNADIGQDSTIGGSVIASGTKSGSTGAVSFGNGGNVGGFVRAKGAVTLNGTTVAGGTTANDPLTPAPPTLTKPTFTWNAGAYAPVVPVEDSATNITNTLDANKNNLSGVYYNNSGSSSAVTIPDNAKVTDDLTIISTGRVVLGNGFTAVGGQHTVVIVALSIASDSIDVPKKLTSASGIDLLLYSLGGVDMKNHVTMTGAIYANSIDMKNTYTVHFSVPLSQAAPPGFAWDFSSSSTYTAVPTLWREIIPGEPPM